MKIYIPTAVRKYVYGAFAKNYGVKLHEMRRKVGDFKTFNEFFTRQIREDCRPIEEAHNSKVLCSPCDGTVLSCGEVDNAEMVCVKGQNYKVDEFLYGMKNKSPFSHTAKLQV